MGVSMERANRLQLGFRWLAVVIFVLTAIQPVLGAFAFFRVADRPDYTSMHEMTAHILSALTLILLGLSIFAGFRRRAQMIGWSGALFVAVVSQVGLGYVARNDAPVLGFHIPLGVAVFAIALTVTLLAFGLRFDRESA